tara:strand:+ start:263 stop:487 length:225 start_codon:yes stop_codon:yes gene_type:complete
MDCLGDMCGKQEDEFPVITAPKDGIIVIMETETPQCEFDTSQLTINSFPQRSPSRYTDFLISVPAHSVRIPVQK